MQGAPAVVTVNERQLARLREYASRGRMPFEIYHRDSTDKALVSRGLIEMRFIGMRWWWVQVTPAGHRAVVETA